MTGKDVIETFKADCLEDWVDILRHFETKKRSINTKKRVRETFKIPLELMKIYTKLTKKEPEEVVEHNKEYEGRLKWTAGKLRIDGEIMKGWFAESCRNTIKHISDLLGDKSCSGTDTILLVGGFSESSVLHEAVKESFKDKRLIVPDEAGLAVLKGAVMFGYDPVIISSRVAKCSYGIRVYRDFDERKHPKNKREQIGGKIKCKDVFALHVKKGQELIVGDSQSSQRYTPLEADQMSLIFDVYTSTQENPQFVTDESCTYIGQLEVDIPGSGKERGVWVNMVFGGTELVVKGKDEKTGKESKAHFDFLGNGSAEVKS